MNGCKTILYPILNTQHKPRRRSELEEMTASSKPNLLRRQSSTPHYQTFPTRPPTSRGKPPQPKSSVQQNTNGKQSSNGQRERSDSGASDHVESPLPKRQLAVLAVIALAEQTALNSISPYLPDMASTFPEVKTAQVGLYVGLIASSFALAQFATNFFWGWLSDRIGRKPVVLLGTLFTAVCFVAFGFCRRLWQAILVQVLMGLVNGNQGVVSTCLGEITDRTNQSKAFTYLPVVYGIGGITGPIVGGLLVNKAPVKGYPYLAPNLASAAVLLVDMVITMLFLEESLEEAKNLPPLGKRVGNIFTRMWQFSSSSTRPTYSRAPTSHTSHQISHSRDEADNDGASTVSTESHHSESFFPHREDGDGHRSLRAKDVLNRDTILILGTFLIFQLSNIAYNSVYPIFAQAPPPTGRSLNPREIGISLAFAGLVTIVFQVGLFGKLREKIGNKTTYRIGLAGFVVAFLLMPFVGYKKLDGIAVTQGRLWLWVELGVVLTIKTVAAVSTLTSALLLVSSIIQERIERVAEWQKCATDTIANSEDYELGARSFGPWHAQRARPDAFGSRQSGRTVSIRLAVHAGHAC